LLQNNEAVPVPTSIDLIKPGDALLVFAIELPDDIGNVPTDLAIPALALARIDSFAGRNGLS